MRGSASLIGKCTFHQSSSWNFAGLYSPGFLLDETDLDFNIWDTEPKWDVEPEWIYQDLNPPEISDVPPYFEPRLKMSLSGLRDGEFKKLGAPSNYAMELETIGEPVRSASSKVKVQIRELEMPDEPHDPFPLVPTYNETVRSKLGKEQPSSMETKINEGSTSKVVNSSEVCESFRNLQEPLKSCVFYTSTLFPGDYEFEEDTLIQLWIAAGFIQTELEQLVERGQTYFKVLHELSIFQTSSTVRKNYDPTTYRVHKDVCELKQQGFPIEYTTMDEGGTAEIKPTTLHSTLLLGGNGTDFDSKIFERFYKAKNLRTFKLQIEYGSPIKHVPHILFVKLGSLQVLDLSSTEIKELPTSVCNLKHLRYLDVSGTPIKKLPESVCELNDLQTLKLRDCSNLVGLPKGTSKLINLQHLDLDGLYQLTSMPPTMGQLTNLQKLSIFVVGREQGFRIEELKRMKKLRGSLCIAKMENISEDEASVAELGDKVAIHSLEFKWSSSHNDGETKFNLIQPHSSIKQLKITRYGATSFPNWLSGENFGSLAILHLSYCNCTHLPALGELRSLESLYINQMHSLEKIGHEFYGGELFHGVAFSNLELLEIDGMPCLEEWQAIQKCYMPKLYKLTIIDCPRLVNLPNFISLKSLQQLRIILCAKIQSFPPGERLPESLQSLTITECPKLKEQCQEKDGEGWCKIAGIPEIWIDDEQQPKIIMQAKESESLHGEEENEGSEEQPQPERESQELDKSRSHGDQAAGTGRPTYPSSRPKTVDWKKIKAQVKEEEKEEKLEVVVGIGNGEKIGELKNINNLRGSLCISKLENVRSLKEASEAALDGKYNLQKLKLKWTENEECNFQVVLAKLIPHENLEILKISGYGGLLFPDWVSNPSFLPNLTKVSLSNCNGCVALPAFWRLKSLKSLSLSISGTDLAKTLNIDFGDIGFISLEILQLKNMPDMTCWVVEQAGAVGWCPFPKLRQLIFKGCPKLVDLDVLQQHGDDVWLPFPKLNQLTFQDCPKLRDLEFLQRLNSDCRLKIKECPLTGWMGQHPNWQTEMQEDGSFIYSHGGWLKNRSRELLGRWRN